MGVREDIEKLLKQASSSMKKDSKSAVARLEEAYSLALGACTPEDSAAIAEELSRAWTRRKSAARSLYFAHKSTKLAPKRKSAWTTLAMTCELAASRTIAPSKVRRAQALFRATAHAFSTAASMTKDAEDKRWLLELARDAARHGEAP